MWWTYRRGPNLLLKLKLDIQKEKKKYYILQNKYTELNNKYEGLLQEQHDEIIIAIKLKNATLKELNNELREKNALLTNMLKQEKKTPKINTKTYTEALSTKQIITQPKIVPGIVIKKKSVEYKSEMTGKIAYYLTKMKNIQTKRIDENKTRDTVTVSCMNEESVKVAEKYLNDKLQNIYNIQKEELKKPIEKIVGYQNTFKMDKKTTWKWHK